MATLTLRNVAKTYANGVPVIHGISMDVKDGEFIVIVGPSGCGKSTLLRMVAGLETISSGDIMIDDRVVNEVEPAGRDIAMVFQNYALYPHMSVFDNMAYGLKIRRFSQADIEARVKIAADILELGKLLQRRPRELSGGQRQRVAMGRAIVREPKVFLFDEPLSNLDAKLRVQMRLEIQKLHQRLSTTSLYVTHDQVEAMTLAQRMIVMNGGIAEQIGTPEEVFERPASTFVAGFIGSPPMNLIPVDVDAQGNVQSGGKPVALPAGSVPASLRSTPAIMGIRPEHLQVAADGLEATLEMVETLGSEQLVHARNASGPLVVRSDTRDAVAHGLPMGSPIRFRVDDPTHLHWFSAADGKRL
jgi:sn-glycerol 3-phosphate transport system ATP-binding protein